jgi:hypothetical protein
MMRALRNLVKGDLGNPWATRASGGTLRAGRTEDEGDLGWPTGQAVRADGHRRRPQHAAAGAQNYTLNQERPRPYAERG